MNKMLWSVVCAGILAVPAVGSAAPVTGGFTFVGQEDVRVGQDYVNFGEFPDIFTTPIGDIEFLTGTGSFVGIGGTFGTIKDIVGIVPGATVTVTDFIEMAARPQLDFTLTQVAPGAFGSAQCFDAPAAGQTCTPPVPLGSPFNLFNDSASSFGVTMRVLGYVTNELGEVSTFTGNFSSQRTDVPFQSALLAISNPLVDDELGYFQSSYSADFAFTPERTVPEPASMLLMGLVLSGMAVAIRRRQ